MHFRSKAEMEHCKELVKQGKITQEHYNARLKLTNTATLPERVVTQKPFKTKVIK